MGVFSVFFYCALGRELRMSNESVFDSDEKEAKIVTDFWSGK